MALLDPGNSYLENYDCFADNISKEKEVEKKPEPISEDRVKQDERYLTNLFTRFPGWRGRM